MARPPSPPNNAALPTPSAYPYAVAPALPPPAKVVTVPDCRAMARMSPLPESTA